MIADFINQQPALYFNFMINEKTAKEKKDYARKWQLENKEKCRINNQRFRDNNPQKYRESVLKSKRKTQPKPTRDCPEACEVCGNKETKLTKDGFTRNLCLDHCHEANKFRGWLCDTDNAALGFVKDSRLKLGQLSNYLDNFYGENLACY